MTTDEILDHPTDAGGMNGGLHSPQGIARDGAAKETPVKVSIRRLTRPGHSVKDGTPNELGRVMSGPKNKNNGVGIHARQRQDAAQIRDR